MQRIPIAKAKFEWRNHKNWKTSKSGFVVAKWTGWWASAVEPNGGRIRKSDQITARRHLFSIRMCGIFRTVFEGLSFRIGRLVDKKIGNSYSDSHARTIWLYFRFGESERVEKLARIGTALRQGISLQWDFDARKQFAIPVLDWSANAGNFLAEENAWQESHSDEDGRRKFN